MRILMVHNHYLVRGGEDVSFAAEVELLREAGHHVQTYVRENEEIETRGRLRTAATTIWSRESRRDVADLLAKGQFDLMHVQNFFPLISPSVYGAARAAGVAVVQTLRNFRPLCAAGLLMREGGNCEKCLGKAIGWSGIRHRCYRESFLGSAVVTGMNGWHRARGTYDREVDRFIVAAELVRRKFVDGGFPEDRIRVKPNVMPDLPDLAPGERQRRAIFVGRLSGEKGVRPTIDVWVQSKLEIPLLVVGTGPLEDELKERAKENPAITFTGRLSISEACRAIAESELLLLPTECYETFGRTVLEAYAMGTPVISSRGTAPGDLVREGETGFLVDSGDRAGLEEQVRRFFALSDGERRKLGDQGLAYYHREFSRERNLELLTTIYQEAIDEARALSPKKPKEAEAVRSLASAQRPKASRENRPGQHPLIDKPNRSMDTDITIGGGDTAQPMNLSKRLKLIADRFALDGAHVLDCGCGEGDYVVAFREMGAHAVGIEYLEEKVARAHALGLEDDLVSVGDAQAMKFDDARFDAVVFNEVLEHVPDDGKALRESFRVLKPGGSLFVFSPNRLYPFETHGVYKKGTKDLLPIWTPFIPYLPTRWGKHFFDYWARNYWPFELRDLVSECGFSIQHTAYVWQTFEGIANEGSGTTNWMKPVRPLLRTVARTFERCPGIRSFGVSQFIHARKGEEQA